MVTEGPQGVLIVMLIRPIKVALVAQLAERVLGKDEVTGSIPVEGSRIVRSYACLPAGRSS